MEDNFSVFINFLAENFSLVKYISAYYRRYNVCNTPFYTRVKSVAEKNPKGLFKDVLGKNNKFGLMEAKWLEYMEKTILYAPKEGDSVRCSYFNEETCSVVSWITTFKNGTKSNFIDMDNKLNDKQTFVEKM